MIDAEYLPLMRRRLAQEGLMLMATRICAEHGISVEAALTERRTRMVRRMARAHLIAVVMWTMGWSTVETGAFFGLDRTTVMYWARKWERHLASQLEAA